MRARLRGATMAAVAAALGCGACAGAPVPRDGPDPAWPAVLAGALLPGGAPAGSPALEAALAAADAFYGQPEAPGGGSLARLGPAGADCAVHVRLPAGEAAGVLLFIHGYREHGLSAPALARAALDAGWAFAGLDLPGHGASPGERGAIGDFSEYGRVVEAALALPELAGRGPVLVVAFSTGGAAVVDHLTALPAGSPARPERFLLLSPLLRSRLWGLSRLGYGLGSWLVRTLPDRTLGVSHDPAWPALARRDPLRARPAPSAWFAALVRWDASLRARPPRPEALRVAWAGGDTVVDAGHGGRVLGRLFPAARQETIPGAWHGLPFEGGPYLEAVLAIVREELAAAEAPVR